MDEVETFLSWNFVLSQKSLWIFYRRIKMQRDIETVQYSQFDNPLPVLYIGTKLTLSKYNKESIRSLDHLRVTIIQIIHQ